MRGRAALLAAKGNLDQINHMRGSHGTLAAATPMREGRNSSGKEGGSGVSFEKKSDRIVAFSKPPPLPPLLGPLVVLPLLGSFSGPDEPNDG
ncbi:hypothetical protein SAY86_004722 [Trapa natans]|uniref:Uncharacterized protein n=1 Tax=Trapa natans TaxID=22666 RepID=A0AAN7RJ67_TRANT|nr:hypothetical protein SAY86_004722 [Trapa natans]